MRWWKALQPNNHAITNEVAQYMRDYYGWNVITSFGRLNTISDRRDGVLYSWSFRYNMTIRQHIAEIQRCLQIWDVWEESLNDTFPSALSIGKYTLLPLPKDIVKQPTSATPFRNEGGSRLSSTNNIS